MWVDVAQMQPSRWQHVVKLSSLCVVLLLLCASGAPWLMKAVGVLALLGLSVVQWHAQRRQARLYCLQQLDRSRWQWQQRHPVQPTRKRPQVGDLRQIQARLLRVEAWLGIVVILQFEVVALGQRHTWLVWRDQVDVENWRRLQVLQRYWSAPLS